jgi:RNA polymerase subunit RPABC4/transcription elongation factor Spt4
MGRAHAMKPPRILPIIAHIVQSGISAVDGITFTQHSVCPVCGGPLAGYDTKQKQFAHLVINDEKKTIYVSVKRFYCTNCHKICNADEPFYPNTRIGSVIIDLCTALSMTMPVNRVPSYLAAMGILVDRSSSRLYTRHISSTHVRINCRYLDIDSRFGIHLPLSIFSLSSLAVVLNEGGHCAEADVLAACGFPSASRRGRNFPLPIKRWINRDEPI